jgi:dTDP-4-dehydrorhamnose reductase
MERVLVTGAWGLVGRYLTMTAPARYKVSGTWCTNRAQGMAYNMDLRIRGSIRAAVSTTRPDIIIHAAGASNVDWCEQNEEEARLINFRGTEYLAIEAERVGAKFVYLSTNAVFDGSSPPYRETDSLKPINVYGRTKHQAEVASMDGLHPITDRTGQPRLSRASEPASIWLS